MHKLRLAGGPLVYALLAAPWCIGLGYSFGTNTALTEIVNGTCKGFVLLPTRLASHAIGVLSFLVEYLIPLVAMVVCYSLMLRVRERLLFIWLNLSSVFLPSWNHSSPHLLKT